MSKSQKQYQLTINVDEEQLIESYTGGDKSIDITQLPLLEELILFECGWLNSSGLEVIDITEINQ